jgi:hypothetical protein
MAHQFGFMLEPVPDNELPEHGMPAVDAMRLIGEKLLAGSRPPAVSRFLEPRLDSTRTDGKARTGLPSS